MRVVVSGLLLAAALVAVPGVAVGEAPEYSLEGTCAVVKLHPDDVSAIASGTAEIVAAELSSDSTGVVPVSLQSVGVLDSVDLAFGFVLGMIALGVWAGTWGRSRW